MFGHILPFFCLLAAPAPAEPLKLSGCVVQLLDEAQIPAQEPGVLLELLVREGAAVKKGDPVAQIDPERATIQKQSASSDLAAAQEKAKSDIEVRVAKATADVAKAEYAKSVEAVRKVPGSISEVEVERLKLTAQKSVLQIEQSQMENRVAQFTRNTKAAELDAAEYSLRRRQITSPLDGVVVAIPRHQGEWVQTGEPLLRVVRMDRLRVEGWVPVKKFNPTEVAGQSVEVEIELARGEKVRFTGKITFVSPLVDTSDEYKVWAEVENRQEKGHWLLRPGHTATMTVQPATAAEQ